MALFVDGGYVYENLPHLSKDYLVDLQDWAKENGGWFFYSFVFEWHIAWR